VLREAEAFRPKSKPLARPPAARPQPRP